MENRIDIARLLEQLADLRKHRQIRRAGAETPLEAYRFRHILDDAHYTNDLSVLIRKRSRANIDDNLSAVSSRAGLPVARNRLTRLQNPPYLIADIELPDLRDIEKIPPANLLGVRYAKYLRNVRIHELDSPFCVRRKDTYRR